MSNKLKTYFSSPAVRHYRQVMAFAVLGMLVGSLLMVLALDLRNDPIHETVGVTETSEPAFVLPESAPAMIRIPKVGINTNFENPLGINDDQTVQVPDSYETVGWYKYGPTPGELGPAVVLGHVDSYQGPAVFWPLGQLKAGDEIFIDREDGTTATFTVTNLERHEQSGFPTKKVYSDLDYAGLRLITCSGTFDKGAQKYSHNLIVFAELVTKN